MSRSAACLVLGLVLGAVPAAAQSPDPAAQRRQDDLARLQRALDSVGELWRQARDLVVLQDSLAHAATIGRLDTIDVGVIRIVSNHTQLPLREAAEAYAPFLEAFYGDAASRLRQRPVVIQALRPDTERRQAERVERWGMAVEEGATVAELVSLFRGVLVLGENDAALRAWLPSGIRPSFRGDSVEAREAYVSLVTSGHEVARGCLAGVLAQCRAALRLNDGNREALLATFATPAERRRQVERAQSYLRMMRNQSGLAECRAGADSACIELLRTVPPAVVGYPLEASARQALVRVAMRLGGRNAYGRLMHDSTASMEARLAAAANAPIDSVITVWRQTVLAARPAPVSVSPFHLAAGLGWILLLGFCGLRSTRWRFG